MTVDSDTMFIWGFLLLLIFNEFLTALDDKSLSKLIMTLIAAVTVTVLLRPDIIHTLVNH